MKAASDLYSPATGEIVEVNEKLTESPNLVNEDPYEEGSSETFLHILAETVSD